MMANCSSAKSKRGISDWQEVVRLDRVCLSLSIFFSMLQISWLIKISFVIFGSQIIKVMHSKKDLTKPVVHLDK